MAVYVDSANIPYGRMIMCHMVADTLDELHAMADKIGIKRKWFQEKSTLHYDVSKSKKKLAIEFGAVEIDRRQLIELVQKQRKGDNHV